MKKFSEYSKKDKIIRICNYVFSFLMLAVSIIYTMIRWQSIPKDMWMQSIGPWLIILVIYALEAIFRYRVSNALLTFYNIYVFFASFLGTTFALYYYVSFYDNIMHGLFGYVGCIVGLFILIKFADYKNMSTLFTMLVMFFVSMGCGAVWEILEYTCDHLFNATAQGVPVNGIVSVEDTMMDILMNFTGMIVFEIHYLIHRLTKKSLGITYIEEDFTNN